MFQSGDVVLVPFPFTDFSAAKKTPGSRRPPNGFAWGSGLHGHHLEPGTRGRNRIERC